MSQKSENLAKAWNRPELVKLGKLVDVAPGPAGTTEGGSGKS